MLYLLALIFGIGLANAVQIKLPDLVPACPEKQVYDTCYTACPPSCAKNPNSLSICTRQCIIGCRCSNAYPIPVMQGNTIKDCIRYKDCCPSNLVLKYCQSSSCTATCDNPKPNPCTKDCVTRCMCPDNKPILHDGKCIKLSQCPGRRCYPKYGPNMHCHCMQCSKCKKKYKKCNGGNNMCGKGECCCCKKCNWSKACDFPKVFLDMIYKLTLILDDAPAGPIKIEG